MRDAKSLLIDMNGKFASRSTHRVLVDPHRQGTDPLARDANWANRNATLPADASVGVPFFDGWTEGRYHNNQPKGFPLTVEITEGKSRV